MPGQLDYLRKLFNGHYWDSLAKERNLIMGHIESIITMAEQVLDSAKPEPTGGYTDVAQWISRERRKARETGTPMEMRAFVQNVDPILYGLGVAALLEATEPAIELIARAICKGNGYDPDHKGWHMVMPQAGGLNACPITIDPRSIGNDLERGPFPIWTFFKPAAAAVLEALKRGH